VHFSSEELEQMRNRSVVGLGIALYLGICVSLAAQTQASAATGLSGDEIAARLEARNREQAQALQGYEGVRVYRVDYHGLGGSKDAGMTVRMSFQAPDSKNFTVVEQEGSKLIADRVLKKLMQSEQEAMEEESRRGSALTTENYDFAVLGNESCLAGSCYVLQVAPRHTSKFLYRGKIWVDAKEFAVVRIEAEPAHSPSFWIKKTTIEHEYRKVADFWFPAKNRTESQIRLGGRASLTIDYTSYKITAVAAPDQREAAKRPRSAGCRASDLSSGAAECAEAALDPLPITK
jgi:hypothetical protein